MYTLEQKIYAVSYAIVYENLHEAMRKFKKKYNSMSPPSASQIAGWKEKLLETGTLVKPRHGSGRIVSATGDNQREAVANIINDEPTSSTRQIARLSGISTTSVRRIIKSEKYRPWKFRRHQELYDADPDRRLEFCDKMKLEIQTNPQFHQLIVFSDEATFHTCGTVNKHNLHYYSKENPHMKLTTPVNSPSVKIWAMINGDGVQGLHICEGTIDGDYYLDNILKAIVWPYFRHRRRSIYQQDGAPPHWKLVCRNFLDEKMPNRWIGRRGSHSEFPPRSPDLTPLDYWLWGYLRDKVYTRRFMNTAQLTDAIREEIYSIPVQMFKNAISGFTKRLDKCISAEGSHFE